MEAILGIYKVCQDNFDLNEETLDGKGTFHSSQPKENTLDIYVITPFVKQSLRVPDVYHDLQAS